MVLLETYRFAYSANSKIDIAFTFKETYYRWVKMETINSPLHKVITTYQFSNIHLWTKTLRS